MCKTSLVVRTRAHTLTHKLTHSCRLELLSACSRWMMQKMMMMMMMMMLMLMVLMMLMMMIVLHISGHARCQVTTSHHITV